MEIAWTTPRQWNKAQNYRVLPRYLLVVLFLYIPADDLYEWTPHIVGGGKIGDAGDLLRVEAGDRELPGVITGREWEPGGARAAQ